ncbi:MAG: putative cation transport regulator ChaB [Nitrosospira sp.]|nr:putative cation transport regulator ChaB [Nitrosospira sp.]
MSFTADGDDPRSTLMFSMLSAFAQFERALIKERQREGIALAKAKGMVCKGRKPALNAERITQLREQAALGVNRTKLANVRFIPCIRKFSMFACSACLHLDKSPTLPSNQYQENPMPYDTLKDLPDNVANVLPKHAQEIYQAAFNSAWDEYKDADDRRGDASREETALKVAWAAVKKEYEKPGDQWRKKP